MLRAISWSGYFQFLLAVLIGYYAVVALIYWRKDLVALVARLQQPRAGMSRSFQHDAGVGPHASQHQNKDALNSAVHDLLEELKVLFSSAVEQQFKKEELLFALQKKLSAYHAIHGTPFGIAVEEHIIEQAVMQCEIILEGEALKRLWHTGLPLTPSSGGGNKATSIILKSSI